MTKGIRSAARTVAATTVSLLIVSAFLERANANQGGEAPGEVVPVLTKAERGRVEKDIVDDLLSPDSPLVVNKEIGQREIVPPVGASTLLDGVFPLTFRSNPLISSQCREAAYRISEDNIAGNGQTYTERLKGIAALWQDIHEGKESLTAENYARVVNKCDVCGPIVNELLWCHVRAVRSNPHTVIFFHVGQAGVQDDDRDQLRTFIESNDERSFVVEARASYLSPNENARLNEELARRRAASVASILQDAGVPQSRIKTIEVVWTPPLLNEEKMASEYGIAETWQRQKGEKEKLFLNQSVVITAYDPDGNDIQG